MGAFEQVVRETVGAAVRAVSDGDDLVAAWHTFANPLGSARRGTLRLAPHDNGLAVEIDLPDTPTGRAVLEANDVAGVVVRPLIDRRDATWTTEERPDGYTTAVYSRWPLRGVIVSSTDRRDGWPEPTFAPSGTVGEPAAEERRQGRRRLWL